MRGKDSWKGLRGAAVFVALCAFAGGSFAQGQPLGRAESVSWVPKELSFTDPGYPSLYGCDSLRAKVRSYLLQLGARPDLEVRIWGCTPPVAPDMFAGVTVHMNVLSAEPGGEPVITAHWKRVDLLASRTPAEAAADCELLSQIKLKVLPLFPARNVDDSAACGHGQAFPARLTAEVLVPDTTAATAAR